MQWRTANMDLYLHGLVLHIKDAIPSETRVIAELTLVSGRFWSFFASSSISPLSPAIKYYLRTEISRKYIWCEKNIRSRLSGSREASKQFYRFWEFIVLWSDSEQTIM